MLPTPTDLKTMDWAFMGQPFVDVPARADIDLGIMDWSWRAQPFVRNFAAMVFFKTFAITAQGIVSFNKWKSFFKIFNITVQGIVSFVSKIWKTWMYKIKSKTIWSHKNKNQTDWSYKPKL